MAEDSFLWTTGGAGDGSATYTRADWARIGEIMAAASGFEGVAPSYRNEMAASDGGANTVDVDTGGAVVDGKPYENNSSLAVNVPSAVGGGNTRIDRIVLRADWTAQTVRITRIAGTDAASPTVPAITQSSGATYDIKICQVLVDTGGNVTVTDERVWAIVAADESTIENNAGTLRVKALGIDTAEIAADAVDDIKVGNRVPQFYRRQGGSATDWDSPGTTSRTPGAVRVQGGAVDLTVAISAYIGSVSITFPTTFSNKPLIHLAAIYKTGGVIYDGDVWTPTYENLTSSGVDLKLRTNYEPSVGDGAQTFTILWLAIGTE